MKKAFCLILFTLATAQQAISAPLSEADIKAQELRLLNWVKTCVSPCIMPEALKTGGTAGLFITGGWALASRGVELRVEGVDQCNSGCTLLVDQMKKWGGKVCVGKGVVWGMHRSRIWDKNGNEILRETPVYESLPIAQWISAHGGIPHNGKWADTPPDSVLWAAYGRCPGA